MFRYPTNGGIGDLWKGFADKFPQKLFLYNTDVVEIDTKSKTVNTQHLYLFVMQNFWLFKLTLVKTWHSIDFYKNILFICRKKICYQTLKLFGILDACTEQENGWRNGRFLRANGLNNSNDRAKQIVRSLLQFKASTLNGDFGRNRTSQTAKYVSVKAKLGILSTSLGQFLQMYGYFQFLQQFNARSTEVLVRFV